MQFKTLSKLGNHRDRSLTLSCLRLLNVIAPVGLRDPDLFAVEVLPAKTSKFSLASTREGSSSHNRRRRFGQDVQHLSDLLERIGIGILCRFGSWKNNIPHGILRVEDPLPLGVPEDPGEERFDVAKGGAGQIVRLRDIRKDSFSVRSFEISQGNITQRLQVSLPKVPVYGYINFASRWKNGGVSLLSFSEYGGHQQAMLLLSPTGEFVTVAGVWHVSSSGREELLQLRTDRECLA